MRLCIRNHEKYESKEYKYMKELKVKIKEMEE